MNAPTYNIGPSTYGSIWATRTDHPYTCIAEPKPSEARADYWNDRALAANAPDLVDVYLLMAQYLYGEGMDEHWDGARPMCTHGSLYSGYCSSETEYGSLYCGAHAYS